MTWYTCMMKHLVIVGTAQQEAAWRNDLRLLQNQAQHHQYSSSTQPSGHNCFVSVIG
jgi:hypothetical protein